MNVKQHLSEEIHITSNALIAMNDTTKVFAEVLLRDDATDEQKAAMKTYLSNTITIMNSLKRMTNIVGELK